MIHKYAEHAELMSRLPVIDVDYCVAESEYGYGLKALRNFYDGDVTGNSFTSTIIQFILFLFCFTLKTGFYDGHRVDDKTGKVVIRRASVTALMKLYPEIDRELTGECFRTTHAVRLGRAGSNSASRESRLVIDGGPLAHRRLDHVAGNIGRMSLADSASDKKKNMCVCCVLRLLRAAFAACCCVLAFFLCPHVLLIIQEKNLGAGT
jgi:hypothetical protein